MWYNLVIVAVIYLLSPYAITTTCGQSKGGSRLPKSMTPEQYMLTVLTHLDDETPFQFNGYVTIKVKNGWIS